MIKFIVVFIITVSARADIYTTQSKLPWVQEVTRKANCVIKKEEYLKELGSGIYTHTDKKSLDVEKSFRSFRPVVIQTYKTRNPWSAAIATTYKSDKTTVYFNSRKNPRAIASMVNTAIHEGSHLNGFSHGDNSPKGKENSVPYKAGSLAEKYVAGCP